MAIHRRLQKGDRLEPRQRRRLRRSSQSPLDRLSSHSLHHSRGLLSVRGLTDRLLGARSLHRLHGSVHQLHVLDLEHLLRAHGQRSTRPERDSRRTHQLLSVGAVHSGAHGISLLLSVRIVAPHGQAERSGRSHGHEDHRIHGCLEQRVKGQGHAQHCQDHRPRYRLPSRLLRPVVFGPHAT